MNTGREYWVADMPSAELASLSVKDIDDAISAYEQEATTLDGAIKMGIALEQNVEIERLAFRVKQQRLADMRLLKDRKVMLGSGRKARAKPAGPIHRVEMRGVKEMPAAQKNKPKNGQKNKPKNTRQHHRR